MFIIESTGRDTISSMCMKPIYEKYKYEDDPGSSKTQLSPLQL